MKENANTSTSFQLSDREVAVGEGRAIVRVRRKESGTLLSAAVCPGCWNEARRRAVLLRRMALMGVEPVHLDDLDGGVYIKGRMHSFHCRYNPDR